jgi:rubrerythrin
VLNNEDRKNVEVALDLEISNAQFYFCAALNGDDNEGKQLFKALGKVEEEHAHVWKKILKMDKAEIPKSDECSTQYVANLKEAHTREARAIAFYRKAEREATNSRIKEIFTAFIEVETDHLQLSAERLN